MVVCALGHELGPGSFLCAQCGLPALTQAAAAPSNEAPAAHGQAGAQPAAPSPSSFQAEAAARPAERRERNRPPRLAVLGLASALLVAGGFFHYLGQTADAPTRSSSRADLAGAVSPADVPTDPTEAEPLPAETEDRTSREFLEGERYGASAVDDWRAWLRQKDIVLSEASAAGWCLINNPYDSPDGYDTPQSRFTSGCGEALLRAERADRAAAAPTRLPPAAPAPQAAPTGDDFTSPTGNLHCSISDEGAHCLAVEHDWTDSTDGTQDDCAGYSDAGAMVERQGPATKECLDGSMFSEPNAEIQTLEYGDALVAGSFRCESQTSGISCTNDQTGHGFQIARSSLELF